MEKTVTILLALKEHLQQSYPDLTTWVPKNDGHDIPQPIIQTDLSSDLSSLVITLKTVSKKISANGNGSHNQTNFTGSNHLSIGKDAL